MQTKQRRIGIISAVHQEQAGLIERLEQPETVQCGMRDYTIGRLWNRNVVCVLSRMGKVAAAATTATLIERFQVSEVLFTGVAGGVGKHVRVGDLVVAEQLAQHDMDCRPLFPRFQIPLTRLDRFSTDQHLTGQLVQACSSFLAQDLDVSVSPEDQKFFRLAAPRVHRGLVASGDEFIHDPARVGQLRELLPGLLAVEMEGAAVAQVCFEFGIPFAVVRTISDSANADSPIDFMRFIDKVASQYAFHLIRHFCRSS